MMYPLITRGYNTNVMTKNNTILEYKAYFCQLTFHWKELVSTVKKQMGFDFHSKMELVHKMVQVRTMHYPMIVYIQDSHLEICSCNEIH